MSGCDPEDFDTIEYKDGVRYKNGKKDDNLDIPDFLRNQENLSEERIIERQLKFVDWLKKNDMYNEHATAHTMRKMQEVWDKYNPEPEIPRCCVCKTTENLRKDGWYGYRCDSSDCMCF